MHYPGLRSGDVGYKLIVHGVGDLLCWKHFRLLFRSLHKSWSPSPRPLARGRRECTELRTDGIRFEIKSMLSRQQTRTILARNPSIGAPRSRLFLSVCMVKSSSLRWIDRY